MKKSPHTETVVVHRPVVNTQPVGPEKFRFFYDKAAPWVNRGSVYGFPMHEEMAEPTILEGECAIGALTALDTGSVLGVTTGKRPHAFYYHPSFYVVDLGLLAHAPADGAAIVRTHNEVVVGGWRGKCGGLFRHDAAREFGTGQEDFYSKRDPVQVIPLPGKGEGVLALAYDAAEEAVYGITTQNRIFRLRDDAKRPQILARADAALAPVLARLPDGRYLGACEEGRLWQYRPGDRSIERLAAQAPCERGKRYVAGVGSLLMASNGLVYGGTSVDGFFFSFDPASGTLVNLGKPHRQAFIRALTEGHEGLIYGIVREPQGLAHLFTYDPLTGGFEDLGLLSTFITVQWTPHAIGALCTGRNGELFLGESDSISHLFVYYPPVVRKV